MKIFGYEISKAAKPTPQEVAGERRASSVYVMPYQEDRPLPTTVDNYLLLDAFKSWVYVCATKNATASAKVTLRLYVTKKKKEQKFLVQTKSVVREEEERLRSIRGLQQYVRKAVAIEEVVEHPFFDLIQSVNPLINQFDLWETTELFLEMTGNAYWYVVQGAMGNPAQIWIIPSQGMSIIPGKGNIIKGYIYQVGLRKVPFEYDEIVHFRFPALKSQLYGHSPMVAAMDAFVFDQRIKKFEGTLLANQGRPEGVLETDQSISDPEWERMVQRLRTNYQGEGRVGKTMILEKGLKYNQLTMTPKDMQYVQGRKWTREEIAAVFGVPMSKLTPDNVNKANAEAGDYQYGSDTIEPRLRRMEEKLNERVMPMYDETGTLFCAFDSAVPKDKQYRLTEINSHLTNGYACINEERERDGLPKVDWGDVPIMGSGMAPLGSTPAAGMTPGGENPFAATGGEQPGRGPADTTKPPKEPAVPPEPKPAGEPTAKEMDEFAARVIGTLKQKIAERRAAGNV
jgi:HK97 family phage portal protein